jgi:threonine dehydratase
MTVSIDSIRAAATRLKGVAIATPLLSNKFLNEQLDAQVFIKPECLQHIGAFKFRGAYNRLSQLSNDERMLGVVAFSSGNHAQGIALAAKMLGIEATIVMPSDAPQLKLEGTRSLGATVRQFDRLTESREEIAYKIAQESGAIVVPSFDDFDVMAGQGTVGLEIVDQLAEQSLAADIVLTPCGGGGLMAGTSTAVKALLPDAKIYGVEQENFDDHYLSKQAGKRVEVNGHALTMCDALMTKTPGEKTWEINSKNVDEFLVVTEDDIARAVSYAFRYLKLVVEPGGAVALAALLSKKLDISGKIVAIVLSGGNIDNTTLQRCLNEHPSPANEILGED